MKIDTHIHTLPADIVSKKTDLDETHRVRKVIDTAMSKGLDAIVLTDFGHIEGFRVLFHNIKDSRGKWVFDDSYERKNEESAVKVSSRNHEKPLTVFLGEEIQTKQGEILGCFLQDYIAPGRSIEETMEDVDEHGGVIIFPHPLVNFFGGIGEKELEKQLGKKSYIKAVEVFNGQLAFPMNYFDIKADVFAEDFNALKVGGSDSRGFIGKQYERTGSVYNDLKGLKEVSKESIRGYMKNKGEIKITGTYNSFWTVSKMMLPVAMRIIKKEFLGK